MRDLRSIRQLRSVRGVSGGAAPFNPSKVDDVLAWYTPTYENNEAIDRIGKETRPQRLGACLDFNGSTDYVTHNGDISSANVLLGTGITFACWAKAEGGTGARMLFAHRDSTNPLLQLSLHSTNGTTAQFRTSTGSIVTTTDTSTTDTEWNHYCVVWDFVTEKQIIYVNGSNVAEDTIVLSGTLTSTETLIGAFSTGASPVITFDGKMYGTFIKEGRLTAEQVASLYVDYDQSVHGGKFYPYQEESGTEVYNINGGGTKTITTSNIVATRATDPEVHKSWANDVGYTLSGSVVIPRDESDTSKDAAGGSLQYTGRVKLNQDVVQSPCGLFDGVGDKVEFSPIALTSDYTISVLAYRDGAYDYMLFGGGLSTIDPSHKGYLWYYSALNRWRVRNDGETGGGDFFVGDIENQKLTVVTLRRIGSELTLYFNGISQGTITDSLVGTLTIRSVGWSYSSTYHFTGGISDFRIYSRGLTDDEILSIGTHGVSGTTPSNTGLEVHLPFTEKSPTDTTIYNKADPSNPGTVETTNLAIFRSGRQDVYHDAVENGHSQYTEVIQGTSTLTLDSPQPFKTIYFEGATCSNAVLSGISLALTSGNYLMLSGTDTTVNPNKFGVYGSGVQWLGTGVEFDSTQIRKYIWEINADNTVSFYQDNVLMGTSTVTVVTDLIEVASGYSNGSGGFVHNFRVYNRELSAAEKTILQNGGDVTDGMTLHYSGSGATPWQDLVGSNNATQAVTNQTHIPAQLADPTLDCLGNTLQHPAGGWNYPPSQLLATATPALTDKFVHGGTFDGSTHELNSTYTPSQNKVYVAYYFKNEITTSKDLQVGFHSSASDAYNIYYWGTETEKWFGFNTWTGDSYGFDGRGVVDDTKVHLMVAKFVFGDHTQGRIWIDGVEQTLSQVYGLTSSRTLGAQVLSFSKEPTNTGQKFDGRISGLNVYSQTLTSEQEEQLAKYGFVPGLTADFEEPLNGTLNNATLTGSADTFWVEEYNNLMLDSNGDAVVYDPEDIDGNYLGLNRIFSDKSDPTNIKNIVVCETPLSGSDLTKMLKYTNND